MHSDFSARPESAPADPDRANAPKGVRFAAAKRLLSARPEPAPADPDRANTPKGVRFAAALCKDALARLGRHGLGWVGTRCRARAGPVFRLTALGAAVAIGAVVVDAAVELGHTHWGAALVALPLVVAVLLAAHLAYPWLVAPAAAAVGLLLAAIATGGIVAWSGDARWAEGLHVGAGAAALAASVVTCALSLRGERLPFGPWRDYVTLTKPRIMALLLITGAGGMSSAQAAGPAGRSLP